MSSLDHQLNWNKYIIGYVNDNRQYSNNWKYNTLQQIITQLQFVSQSWEHLIFTSGGKFEISKCRLYIIEWKFHADDGVFLEPLSNVGPFTIVSSFYNTKYDIQFLFNNSYMKYLGIQSTPSKKQDILFNSSMTTAKTGARTLDIKPFEGYHANIYLNNHLNSKLYFPFTCPSFLSKNIQQ